MKISRASFLKTCSLAAAGALFELPAIVRWTEFLISRPPLDLKNATAALFTRHLHERFTVRIPDHRSRRFVLARVTEGPATSRFEQFSIVFHGPAGERMPDGSYRFEHPSLGRFDLMIVAVGPSRTERTTYEACFSRRLPAVGSAAPAV